MPRGVPKGTKRSEETKRRMSEAQKGHPVSERARLAIAEGNRKRKKPRPEREPIAPVVQVVEIAPPPPLAWYIQQQQNRAAWLAPCTDADRPLKGMHCDE